MYNQQRGSFDTQRQSELRRFLNQQIREAEKSLGGGMEVGGEKKTRRRERD